MNDTFHRPETANDPLELSLFSRLLINLAPADPDVVLKKCLEDISKLKISGAVSLGTFCYNSAMFTGVASHLAGQFNLGIAIAGTGLAAYISAADTYFFKSAQLVSGFDQLEQGGLEIHLPRRVRRMIRRSLGIRLAQGCLLSFGLGTMGSLIIYSSDIRTRIQLNDLRNDAGVVQQIGDQTSNDLKRENNAVQATTSSIESLTKQINDRLIRNPNAVNSSQVQAFETRRAAEESKLASQKAELSKLEGKLSDGLVLGPAMNPSHMGVLAQINALEQMGRDDWKILFVILLAELLAASFDLASVIARTNWLPTKYSVLMAQEFLNGLENVIDEMVPIEPETPPASSFAPVPANDNGVGETQTPTNDNLIKRGRGRPPKNPPANGQIV